MAKPGVVNDVVAADKSCKIESLSYGILRDSVHARPFVYRLSRYVLVTGANEVGPDFVGNYVYIIFLEYGHSLFQLPFFPYAAGRIVR